MSAIQAAGASARQTTSDPRTASRLVLADEIRFSEIISALSVALDITQGHHQGHCMRSALIGMRLAQDLRVPTVDRSALFYALLLKDLGCSSNAAKLSYLFGADDHRLKRSIRMTEVTRPTECFKVCWSNCAEGGSLFERLLKMAVLATSGREAARKISEIRCERGAEIARMLRLPEATATAILHLDEHWDGHGTPRGLRGEEISLLGRICCLAQTSELFFTVFGRDAALDVALERRGTWFDPDLVDALAALKRDASFWQGLRGTDLVDQLSCWEPQDAVLLADEACLDRVAEAFAKVVDAKSPWTYQHSTRVAEIAVGVAQQFGCPEDLKRDLRRAALLHDIGKLGVSNLILDKPGKPTPDEFAQIRKHTDYSLQILQRVAAFKTLADVASAHHERLDGRGYHRGLTGPQLHWATRVLTVADVAEAMSAKRPYRDAIAWPKIRRILTEDAGRGVDPDCLEALECWHERGQIGSRVEAQLAEVDRLLGSL